MTAGFRQIAKDYAATPAEFDVRGLLGGVLSADWRQALIARGFGGQVTVGAISTGITGGGAGTVLDIEQPELLLSVASGYTMIPLRLHAEVNIGLQTTDSHVNEILFGVNRGVAWDGTGTFTSETVFNMRTDMSAPSGITAASAFTADPTVVPVVTFDLARREALTDVQGTAATVLVTTFDLVYEPTNPPFIVGPACILGYAAGSIAVTAYMQAYVLVIPSSLVTGLS